MALCPEDLSKVRMGKGLTKYSIQYLRDIRTFIGTTFRIKPDDETGTTLFSCIGSGYTNVSKKAA
jgi:RNA 3'-terminal phosphate cyclase-like protein